MSPGASTAQVSEAEIRELVRSILTRLLSEQAEDSQTASPTVPPVSPKAGTNGIRPLIDEATLRSLAVGTTLTVPPGALVTPLARQIALERHIDLITESSPADTSLTRAMSMPTLGNSRVSPQQRIAIGADHGGYALKEVLKPHLQSLGYEVTDCGTYSTDSVDYPDIAYAVARLVADGKCANGIIIDGAGIGSCMAANKVPGVRAALCYDHTTAVNSREHNHANVLTLGAGLTAPNLAKQIVTDWLKTPYGPGRHARRVDKIMAIEKRYLKG